MPKLVKIGNSYGITIPREILEAMDLNLGDEFILKQVGSHLELTPAELRPRLRPIVQTALDRTMDKFDSALKRLAQ